VSAHTISPRTMLRLGADLGRGGRGIGSGGWGGGVWGGCSQPGSHGIPLPHPAPLPRASRTESTEGKAVSFPTVYRTVRAKRPYHVSSLAPAPRATWHQQGPPPPPPPSGMSALYLACRRIVDAGSLRGPLGAGAEGEGRLRCKCGSLGAVARRRRLSSSAGEANKRADRSATHWFRCDPP